ncbi:hypothetical protein jhhlp_005012 [Lomentospora prolificans]|uniref:ER transporter 6TM N-terminal domain-containing protein n=1 Tax=Lomentospora prolificans TaxID=41688 RepID=A0A2N3N874_9PEZI|nr:hypothetical protein jhhlp_005012 [Lomentospora prolificans]
MTASNGNMPPLEDERLSNQSSRPHQSIDEAPQRKIPTFFNHFSSRELKVFFRCWVAGWVGCILMFIGPVLRNIGATTFFAGFVLLIFPPSGIVFVYILGIATLLLGMLLGWGWGAIVMKAALAARSAPDTEARLAELQRAAVQTAAKMGVDPRSASQILIYQGFLLDARVTVVTYCLVCLFFYLLARVRASNPKLALFQLFATIICDIYLLFTPVLPAFSRTLPLRIIKPATIGAAIGLVCSILFFPRSTSYVVLGNVENLLDLLMVPLRFTSATLGADKSDEDRLIHLQNTKAKIIAEYREMVPCLAFLPLDFSVGSWGPKDVKEITEGIKQVLGSIMSLLDFHTSRISGEAYVMQALQKYADVTDNLQGSTAADEKPHEIGGQQMLQLGEFIHGLRCPDNQPVREDTVRKLIHASSDAISACLEGLEAAKECIVMVNCRRWYRKLPAAERELVSNRCHRALIGLQKARPTFIHESTETLLESYIKRLRVDNSFKTSDASVAGRLRSLVIGMVFEEHLAAAMDSVEGLLDRVVTTFDNSPRPRLWSPANFNKASAWAFGKSNRAPSMAPTSEEDPDEVIAEQTKEAAERLRISRGHYTARRSKLGQAVVGSFRWLTNSDGLFALRMVVVTIAVSIPGLLPQTAGFYYREKGLWALIMAQTGLVVYMADFTFGVISRLVGTVAGGVLGLVVWYVGSGGGPGNPYGLSAVMVAAVFILMWIRLYLSPRFLQGVIMGAVTFVLVIGYSYADTHIPSYGNPGVVYNVFWRRLVLVLIGVGASIIVQLFPRPPSAARHISKTLSHSIRSLSDHYALLLSSWGKSSTDGKLLAASISLSLYESLSMLDSLIGLLRYEFSCSPFDSESLSLVQSLCQSMNRNLGRMLSLSGTLPLEYQDRLANFTGILDQRSIGEVMAVLGICDQALKTGDALPEVLPAPLVRRSFEYWQQHHPVVDLACDPDLVRNEHYRRFCVALSAYIKFLGNLDELVLVLKGVLGESHLVAQTAPTQT